MLNERLTNYFRITGKTSSSYPNTCSRFDLRDMYIANIGNCLQKMENLLSQHRIYVCIRKIHRLNIAPLSTFQNRRCYFIRQVFTLNQNNRRFRGADNLQTRFVIFIHNVDRQVLHKYCPPRIVIICNIKKELLIVLITARPISLILFL